MITATTTIAFTDVIDLFKDVASFNLGYLAVSVTILALLAGAFYLFNFKPLQDKLEKQEAELEKMSKKIKEDFQKLDDNIAVSRREAEDALIRVQNQIEKSVLDFLTKTKSELDTKVEKSEKRLFSLESSVSDSLKSLEYKHKSLELSTLWDTHYIWRINKVYDNELSVLIEFLEKTINYQILVASYDLCLSVIGNVLDNKLTLSDGEKKEYRERLTNAISKIKGLESEKKELLEKIGVKLY